MQTYERSFHAFITSRSNHCSALKQENSLSSFKSLLKATFNCFLLSWFHGCTWTLQVLPRRHSFFRFFCEFFIWYVLFGTLALTQNGSTTKKNKLLVVILEIIPSDASHPGTRTECLGPRSERPTLLDDLGSAPLTAEVWDEISIPSVEINKSVLKASKVH